MYVYVYIRIIYVSVYMYMYVYVWAYILSLRFTTSVDIKQYILINKLNQIKIKFANYK